MTYISTAIILLFFCSIAVAQDSTLSLDKSNYDKQLQKGIEAFYQTQWGTASEVFDHLKKMNAHDPRSYFFDSMIPFWKYFFAEKEQEAADDFLDRSEKAVDVGLRRLQENPNDTTMVFLLSGLYGYRSLVAASEKEYRTALESGFKGYKYTRFLLSINEEDPKALIGKGIFLYMVGNVPGELRWMSHMFGVKGDKEKGFAILEKAASTSSYISNDAKMILFYLYKREGKIDKALSYIKDLCNQYEHNVIFHFNYAELLERKGKKREARKVYNTVIERSNGYLQNLSELSRIRLQQL